MAAIEVHDICKSFGAVKAVDKVSLCVEEGELFGLIGPDGAGKSTIYRMLATLTRPDSGSASLLGLNLEKDYLKLRTRIGYMPEQFSLYPELTVQENLKFFASMFGVRVEDNYELIAPVFSQLEQFPKRRAGKLSGGMKQKLALSCALIHRPEILLLDEPTTGVDAVSRSEFWDMLATLREQGITIMVSTSYMDEAERCHRVAMIDHGHILMCDTPEALRRNAGENLFAARSKDMFSLLTALRALPHVKDCYTFGATIHFTVDAGFDLESTRRILCDAEIMPVQATLEDLFIKLTSNER